MGGYANIDNAAALSGLAVTEFNETMRSYVDKHIELMLGREFGESNSHTQYFDIPGGGVDYLQLSWYPVIAVQTFRDNQRESGYTDLVEDEDFTVDKDAGILKLIKDDYNILKGSTSLTVGTKTVMVTYTHGYARVPNDIAIFADWMLAWMGEIKKTTSALQTADGAVLRRIQIGDYQEAYDVQNTNIDKKYKGLLGEMASMLVAKYKRWGEDGNYFATV